MSKKFAIPDAWDDDWEAQADKADAAAEPAKVEKEVKISKAERLAQHAETNKKIWESAEAPETFHFLAARDNVPFKQEFKPAMKVLSRKPVVQKIDPATGLAKLALDDGEDEGDEERKINQPTPEELRLKAQREREEKQRRYDEARARILGTPSGRSTPGSTTPPTEEGKESRGKGRGRKVDRQDIRRPDSQGGNKELFDPNYTPKPGVTIQKRTGDSARQPRQTRDEEQPIRSPRGPDGSGRGGFGFTSRGASKS